MTKTGETLVKRLLALPRGERFQVFQRVLQSEIDDENDAHEISAEWWAELERRVADEDPTHWIPGEKVIAMLRQAQKRDEAKERAKKRRRGP
jgi:putative addiction module component (TIGR02574 family)